MKITPNMITMMSFMTIMNMQVTMGTTAAESMNASANIFLGQSEAPLMIRPYLKVIIIIVIVIIAINFIIINQCQHHHHLRQASFSGRVRPLS